jgi:hypothetical protein
VTALEGERIRLGSNRRGLEALELERLPILRVAELMRDKKFGFEAGPAAAWAYVLARDERWKKLVLAADPLYADAERDYPERMAVAQAADTLAHLAATGIPADAATADVTLQSIEELLREYSALALVSRRLSALRALAQAALDRLFESGGLASCLAGKLEDLGRGGVRLSYDFDTPLELSDFTQTGYLSSRALDRPRHDFEVSKGCLTTHGFACLRSRIAFQGPQRVRCRARYALPNGSYDPRFLFLLACNDDGLVSFAATDFGGSLQVIDMVRNYVKQSPGSAQIVVGEAYQLELIFDGSDLTASVNGMARGSVSAGPRKSGSVFLFTAADFTISVEELVLEGTPTPESLAGLRNAWSAGRLTALGFE